MLPMAQPQPKMKATSSFWCKSLLMAQKMITLSHYLLLVRGKLGSFKGGLGLLRKVSSTKASQTEKWPKEPAEIFDRIQRRAAWNTLGKAGRSTVTRKK
jgi:hypothetical protein